MDEKSCSQVIFDVHMALTFTQTDKQNTDYMNKKPEKETEAKFDYTEMDGSGLVFDIKRDLLILNEEWHPLCEREDLHVSACACVSRSDIATIRDPHTDAVNTRLILVLKKS